MATYKSVDSFFQSPVGSRVIRDLDREGLLSLRALQQKPGVHKASPGMFTETAKEVENGWEER